MGIVKFSKGNSKMGAICSVSLPSVVTCRVCGCQKKCYARKLERLRPPVAKAYAHNLKVLQEDPDTYWREVEAFIMMSRFFRFHVSGDIPDSEYFKRMVEIAKRNQHCQILCFTKQYEIVNEYIEKCTLLQYAKLDFPDCMLGETHEFPIPANLHVVFSGWPGLEMDNPHKLPEAHVRFRDGTTTAREDALDCGGNCTECACTDAGCWVLKSGEQVIFDEH